MKSKLLVLGLIALMLTGGLILASCSDGDDKSHCGYNKVGKCIEDQQGCKGDCGGGTKCNC